MIGSVGYTDLYNSQKYAKLATKVYFSVYIFLYIFENFYQICHFATIKLFILSDANTSVIITFSFNVPILYLILVHT